ncbi:hypothetical protein GCM10022226_37390 [Sphaerisporangium flaviroseum]|uniref:Tetratricopeptide repeat protein n=1 Tax=Sphaerisporangium flaviroseum TaxID=509199 RepID=A0ABP7IA02_9ACTN
MTHLCVSSSHWLNQAISTRDLRFRPNLAGTSNNLAYKLGSLGRAEEASAASQKSVTLYQQIDQPHELANALNGLARPSARVR